MKRFLKIFASVVAMAAIVGCATDATEDLGVKVGGTTQLTLSLDGARTQLGEKADGVYPLTWSEDDQISVNGVASDKLSATNGAGSANATFTFGGALTTPYFIAYPAADAANQVKFAATQYYSSNTSFESGVATMYGYSENGSSVKLQHLTGVLKIGISKGDAVIKSVRISTVDRKPIAGTFEAKFNAASGEFEFTPVENKTSDIITYYFDNYDEYGDGIDLSAQDGTTYVYITVPVVNGEVYNELYVTLTDMDGGVMYKKVNADATKPLKAGTIREFSEDITYAPIDTEKVFVIDSYYAMDSFKMAVEEAEATLAKADATEEDKAAANVILSRKVVIVADIDMSAGKGTSDAWKSINAPNYTGEFNGNGYAFKNLPTPLFDTVAATIKGVHLRNVQITETANPSIGALVRFLDATNNANAAVSNCSADGTILVNSDGSKTEETFYTAGLVGYTNSTQTFSNLRSEVDITVSGTVNGKYSVCGVVCATAGALENVTNLGVLTYNADATNTIYLTGVCYEGTSFSNCSNGDGSVKAGTETKRGSILVTNNLTTIPCMAGIAGEMENMSNCHNYGDITLSGSVNASNIYIGGIARQFKIENGLIENCSNSGALSVLNKVFRDSGTGTLRIGGAVCWMTAFNKVEIRNCTNYGTITLGENFEAEKYSTFIGGIMSMTSCSVDYTITFTGCRNDGDIYAKKGSKTMLCSIGGLLGYTSGNKNWIVTKSFTNNGDMYIDCTTNTGDSNYLALGGVYGFLTNCNISVNSTGYLVNNGDINFGGEVTGGRLIVGGYIGGTNNKAAFQDDVNIVVTGNITCTGIVNDVAAHTVAGVIGTNVNVPILNAQCYSIIKAYDKTNKKSYGDCVGFLCGKARSSSIYSTNCSVGGQICRGLDADDNEVIENVNASTALTTLYPTAITEDNLTAEGVTYLSSAEDINYNR